MESDFDAALVQAPKLAKQEDADYLPGCPSVTFMMVLVNGGLIPQAV